MRSLVSDNTETELFSQPEGSETFSLKSKANDKIFESSAKLINNSSYNMRYLLHQTHAGSDDNKIIIELHN